MLVVSVEAKGLNHNMFYYSGPFTRAKAFLNILWRLRNINNNF